MLFAFSFMSEKNKKKMFRQVETLYLDFMSYGYKALSYAL